MMRDLDIQIYEANISLYYFKVKRTSPRHIIMKLSQIKHKEKIIKKPRQKKIVTYKRTLIRLSADFSTESL